MASDTCTCRPISSRLRKRKGSETDYAALNCLSIADYWDDRPKGEQRQARKRAQLPGTYKLRCIIGCRGTGKVTIYFF